MTTLHTLLSFLNDPIVSFWIHFVLFILLAIGSLGYTLTKGFIGGYFNADISENLKITLVLIHGLGSLFLAMILPNNYLNEIDFFRVLYDKNGLWILASFITLLFIFIVLIGTLFTVLFKSKIKEVNE